MIPFFTSLGLAAMVSRIFLFALLLCYSKCDPGLYLLYVWQVLDSKDHKLHGRTIDPKPANPRQGIKKIFVGRLDPGVPEDDVKAYFGGFGTVSFINL